MAEESDKKEVIKKVIGKVALQDASKVIKYGGLEKACSPSTGSEKSYPCLYIDAAQAPFLKEYEVDDDVVFVVKARIIGHNLNESRDYSCDEYRLEIRKVGKPD